MKTFFGIVFFLIDLFVLLIGTALCAIGIGILGSGSGEGGIKLVVKGIGEISGVNGQLIVFIIGALLIGLALAYAYKAYRDYLGAVAATGAQHFLNYFAPPD